MKTATYYQPESEGNRTFNVTNETEKEADGVKLKFADLTNDNGDVIVGACPVLDVPAIGACTIDKPTTKDKEPAK